ncbi:HD domain-containing protein [Sphingobium sp. YR768]|uniref:HD domain-containing protein n=1 Tax=Sphingobium sp. YR768 TaxID=1884365 RepID=UPI0008D6EA02|nr:ATP-binding protein [Sphingobium sp. YR768]SER90037.1 Histidine kinase-, DNA gyrase B-, and HSP90-like ATPase [Sphingobium sp. YR768]
MTIADPVSELHSTALFSQLRLLNADYADRAITFLEAVAPILASTITYFPLYTRHDAHHGFRVIKRIEQILTPASLSATVHEALTAPSIYLLILAAYAHDLGMTVFDDEADQLCAELGISRMPGWELDPRLQAYLRREHSRRGGSYIGENAARLAVPVPLVDALDRIMQAHNLSIDTLETQISSAYAAQEKRIDVRQLAIILCVADALEFSDTRVIEGVFEAIAADPSPAAHISYLENMKHVCIGDSLAIDEDGRVLVSGTFRDAAVLALAHRTFDQMEGWIRGYCDLDRRLDPSRLRIRPEPFLRTLAFPGGRFERLGVRLNTRNVIDLIASNAVWKNNAGLPIRELLQNAVEACRYRQYHSSKADAYSPKVDIVFNRARHEIVISDNGCGMTERVVLNNLLTIGSSRSAEPGYGNADYAPIARFGIGFWSVFTIAKSADVITASFEPYRGDPSAAAAADGISFKVALDDLHDYTVFHATPARCGTTVTLHLRDDVALDDIYERTREQILCSEIPISFRLDDEESTLPDRPALPEDRLLGSRAAIVDEYGIQVFRWSGSKGHTDASLLLAYRMVDGKPTFLLESGVSILNALPGLARGVTGICGFTVPLRLRHLCIDLFRVGTCTANRTTPRGIGFSLDRTQMIENEASLQFEEEVTDLIHEGYRAFLRETGGQDLPTVAALREQAAMHGGNVYDVFTKDELYQAVRRFPDLAPIRLYPFSQSKPIYIQPDEIHKVPGQAFLLQQTRFAGVQGPLQVDPSSKGSIGLARTLAPLSGPDVATVYAMATERSASWLFDADPNSAVVFVQTPIYGTVPLLLVDLQAVDIRRPAGVLAEVSGRWSGAVYLRDFEHPNGKPYVFLGRYRIVVKIDSRLAKEIAILVRDGRSSKLADLVADLQEDEAGYPPARLAGLL